MTIAHVYIKNVTPADPAGGGPDVVVDTLVNGESRIGIEQRLEPQQSVTETVGEGEEIRVRTL